MNRGAWRPIDPGLKAGGITLLVMATIAGIGWSLIWTAMGGTAYEPTDRTVRNARAAADRTARTYLDAIVDELAPAIGAPTMRAVVDVCTANEMMNNRLSCGRRYFIYYPLASQVPDAATVAGSIPTTPWQPGQCYVYTGTTVACWHAGSYSTNLTVTVVSTTANTYARYLPGVGSRPVEESGTAEMESAVATGAYVLVTYNTRYFSD